MEEQGASMTDISDIVRNPFWTHPLGDPTTLPCTHLAPQHPGGDTITVPCTHVQQQHPAGDPVQMPCTHIVPEHPQGHTMRVPCTHGFVQQHPAGDRIGIVMVPCVHVSTRHPEGDSVTVPCTHMKLAHPDGDTHMLPCPHVGLTHPNGDPVTTPCVHMQIEHPDGHRGPNVPCAHPMQVVRKVFDGRLVFYTDDAEIQHAAIRAVRALQNLGVDPTKPRPLSIFHHPPINGNPNDNRDPMWSHYQPVMHYFQLIAGRPNADNIGTLLHEMGHAILGHSIPNHFAFGPHNSRQVAMGPDGNPWPALAMSEGWAEFVGLVIATQGPVPNPRFNVASFETVSIPPNPNIEYCVTCALWDLFDANAEEQPNPDRVSLSFQELFRVYSPTLETLSSGPVVTSVGDFMERLKRNHPRNRELWVRIDEVRRRNVG